MAGRSSTADLLLGAHMSIAGGVHRALERGASIGCDVVQVFTRNQTQWRAPLLPDDQRYQFRALAPRFARVFAHASYLINLAAPGQVLWRRSIGGLVEELARCEALGLPFLVLHPGSHRGSGAARGIRRVAEGIRRALGEAGLSGGRGQSVEVALETTAGSGSALGSRFEELRDLLDRLDAAGVRAGVCLDTCHVFASGWDLRIAEGYRATWDAFDTIIGRKLLRAIHANDSKKPLGSRIDRHAHIGKGEIGLAGFRLLVRDPTLRGVPLCLETPKENDLAADRKNLAALRRLARVSAPP